MLGISHTSNLTRQNTPAYPQSKLQSKDRQEPTPSHLLWSTPPCTWSPKRTTNSIPISNKPIKKHSHYALPSSYASKLNQDTSPLKTTTTKDFLANADQLEQGMWLWGPRDEELHNMIANKRGRNVMMGVPIICMSILTVIAGVGLFLKGSVSMLVAVVA
ncbi:hypothetical protein EJ08DRAFT_44924 [Tothia fuscella]|uniref:Uncharacterized protein n=1 Tax=Tothia fuscella TaxID=1048955 RepID=A0A9P4NFC7_9PEZI|nr:hypothetical protein EJ08DRAFT_44924 [Tothia fuscella]